MVSVAAVHRRTYSANGSAKSLCWALRHRRSRGRQWDRELLMQGGTTHQPSKPPLGSRSTPEWHGALPGEATANRVAALKELIGLEGLTSLGQPPPTSHTRVSRAGG